MAAALDQQALLHGGPDGAADIDAGDRTQRSGTLGFAGAIVVAVRRPRDHARGPLEPLDKTAGDETDDALVPLGRAQNQHRQFGIGVDHHAGFDHGRIEHGLLDRLALAIELVEQRRDLAGFQNVRGRQQPGAERRVADAATGVDARSQNEAERVGRRRRVQRGHVEQGAHAEVAPLAHDLQSLGHEGAIEANERDHVTDRRQRHDIQHVEEIGRRHLGTIKSARAQRSRRGDEQHERDACRAQMPQA